MTLRRVLADVVKAVCDEAEKNPRFADRLAAALSVGVARDALSKQRTPRGKERILRSRNRRPEALLDPVQLARQGELYLRSSLGPLSLDELRDIVADYGMDPGKLVTKWRTADRIIDRIVEISLQRAQKGNAFREQSTDVLSDAPSGTSAQSPSVPELDDDK